MVTKEDVLWMIDEEAAVCKHLFSKLPANSMDYRPSEKQRSMLELLHYITLCPVLPVLGMLNGNWEHAPKMSEKAKAMDIKNFPAELDKQVNELRGIFAEIPDAEWNSRILDVPSGQKEVMGRAMFLGPARFLTAYRMQLFLYAKAAGATDLNTRDCWGKRTA